MQALQRLARVFRTQRGAQRLQPSAFLFQQFDLDAAFRLAGNGIAQPGRIGQRQAKGKRGRRLPQVEVDPGQAGQDGVVRGTAQAIDARLRSQAQRLPCRASLAFGAAHGVEPDLVCLELPRLFQQHMAGGEQGDEQQELEQVAAEKAQQGREKSAQWSTEGGGA